MCALARSINRFHGTNLEFAHAMATSSTVEFDDGFFRESDAVQLTLISTAASFLAKKDWQCLQCLYCVTVHGSQCTPAP